MDTDIFETIRDLGYKPNFNNLNDILNNINKYSQLVSWLTHQLNDICKLDEKVHPIESDVDLTSFHLEINSFLKELKCPYSQINEKSCLNQNERFNSRENKLLLLNYLGSELQAASMIAVNIKPSSTISDQKIAESDEAIALKKLLITLGFGKPPSNITWPQIWAKVEGTIKDLLTKVPLTHLGKPILNASLTSKQWSILEKINRTLNDDFKLRREMLLKRLDVTIQSFKWADRLKVKNDEITRLFDAKRKELNFNQRISFGDLLAARDDLLNQEKTCSTHNTTRSKLYKLIIPNVPDRGGRTGELQPPPPEMPMFMQRQQQQQQHHHQSAPQHQRVQSGRMDSARSNDNKNWSNQQQQNYYEPQQQYQQNQYDNNFRPKSDFERFQNQDFYDDNNSGQQNRSGGNNRGGRGRGRGGRGDRY